MDRWCGMCGTQYDVDAESGLCYFCEQIQEERFQEEMEQTRDLWDSQDYY